MKRFSILFLAQLCLVGSAIAQTIEYSNIEIEEHKEVVKVHKKKYSFATFNYGFYGMKSYSQLSREKRNISITPPFAHSIGFTFGQVRQWGWYADIQFGTHMNIKKNYSPAQKDDKAFASCFSITPGVVVRCGIPLYATLGIGYGYIAANEVYYYYDMKEEASTYVWKINDASFGFEKDPANTPHSVAWELGLMGILPYNITISAQLAGIGRGVGAKFSVGYAFELPKDKQ